LGGSSWRQWRTTAKLSFGPFVPKTAYDLLLRSTGRSSSGDLSLPILREPYRKSAEQLLHAVYGDPRPQLSQRAFSRRLLIDRENADKMSLALSGLDVRDPTADRRLVEFGLSIPAQYLVAPAGAPSPVYEAAFKGRIPPEILNNRMRGLQGADWFNLFPAEDVRSLFQMLGANPLVSELFDPAHVERMIANWPINQKAAGAGIGVSEAQLLSALAVADFVALHFPEG
jgi:asparagine synthase (glutamine-hydrolysing)